MCLVFGKPCIQFAGLFQWHSATGSISVVSSDVNLIDNGGHLWQCCTMLLNCAAGSGDSASLVLPGYGCQTCLSDQAEQHWSCLEA